MAPETRISEPCAVLEKIQPLLPEIAVRAAEIEQLGAIPADINARLSAAGAYTMLIPTRYGGSDLQPVQLVQVLEALARTDASVAWTAMVSAAQGAVFARFSPQMIDRAYTATPNVLVRGASAPKGIAEPVPGGYRVKGRWPMGSGSYDYNWVVGNCMVMEGGKPRIGPNGAPETRAVLVPKANATFLDTWHAVGLKGSASHDFVIDEAFVPEVQTANVFTDPATFDTPVHRLPLFMVISLPHAAVALGIAQGALDDVAEIAKSKRPAFDPRLLKENPVFNYRFGEIATRLESVRTFLHGNAHAMWAIANSGVTATPLQTARTLAMVSFVQRECVEIVQIAFELAGSNACYEASVLQRRWRDIRTLAQHVAAGTGHLETVGQLLISSSM